MPLLHTSVETLRGFGAFTRVITRGNKYEKKPINAFIYSSFSEKDLIRVGYTVTKKIRKAPQRNRLKRLMREAFQISKEKVIKNKCSDTLIEIVFMYNGDTNVRQHMVKFASISQALSSICSMIKPVKAE
jgi:ribonuclease P protein component